MVTPLPFVNLDVGPMGFTIEDVTKRFTFFVPNLLQC